MNTYKKKPIDKKKAIRMYKKGIPITSIAFAVGISVTTLQNRLKTWGVEKRPKKITRFW